MDFLSTKSYYAGTDFVIGPDGTIVQEWIQLELMQFAQYDSVTFESPGTNQAYTCQVAQVPQLECLDVAGASTLRNLVNQTSFNQSLTSVVNGGNALRANVLTQEDLMVDMIDVELETLDSTTLYGIGPTCDAKRVGDGVINGMDMFVYGASLFRLGPYANIGDDLSAVSTVQGREDTQSRCSEDPLNRLEWQQRLAFSACYALRDEPAYIASGASGRRLNSPHDQSALQIYTPVDTASTIYPRIGVRSPQYADLNARVYEWARGGGLGKWYIIHIPHASIAVELFVRGLEMAPATAISNALSPAFNATFVPINPDKFHLRFIRHREYSSLPTDECAIVQATGDQLIALQAGYINIAQRLPSTQTVRRFICGLDLVIWKPTWAEELQSREFALRANRRRALDAQDDCPMQLAAGSTAMNGVYGAIQRESRCVLPLDGVDPQQAPPLLPSSPAAPPPPATGASFRVVFEVNDQAEFEGKVEEFKQMIDQEFTTIRLQYNFNITANITVEKVAPLNTVAAVLPATDYYTSRMLQEAVDGICESSLWRADVVVYADDVGALQEAFAELMKNMGENGIVNTTYCESGNLLRYDDPRERPPGPSAVTAPSSPPSSPPLPPPTLVASSSSSTALYVAIWVLSSLLACCCCCFCIGFAMRRRECEEKEKKCKKCDDHAHGKGKSRMATWSFSRGEPNPDTKPLLAVQYI